MWVISQIVYHKDVFDWTSTPLDFTFDMQVGEGYFDSDGEGHERSNRKTK